MHYCLWHEYAQPPAGMKHSIASRFGAPNSPRRTYLASSTAAGNLLTCSIVMARSGVRDPHAPISVGLQVLNKLMPRP
jgi:hypothetical protein